MSVDAIQTAMSFGTLTLAMSSNLNQTHLKHLKSSWLPGNYRQVCLIGWSYTLQWILSARVAQPCPMVSHTFWTRANKLSLSLASPQTVAWLQFLFAIRMMHNLTERNFSQVCTPVRIQIWRVFNANPSPFHISRALLVCKWLKGWIYFFEKCMLNLSEMKLGRPSWPRWAFEWVRMYVSRKEKLKIKFWVFKNDWTERYGSILLKSSTKLLCLTSNKIVEKSVNVKRHYET